MPQPKDDEHGRHDQTGNEDRRVLHSPFCRGNGARDPMEAVMECFPAHHVLLLLPHDPHAPTRGTKVSHEVYHPGAHQIYDRTGSVYVMLMFAH